MLTALKITGICILSVIILYLLLLAISALLVHPGKEYTTNSRFYRFLLNSTCLKPAVFFWSATIVPIMIRSSPGMSCVQAISPLYPRPIILKFRSGDA